MKANLTFCYGAMGSSKTANLLIRAYNFEEKGINFLCLKPGIDDREGFNVIKSRIPGLVRECLIIYENNNIYEVVYSLLMELDSDNPIEYLLIDEAQFLSLEQIEQLVKIVDELNINVCCYGLRTDFQTNLFEGSKRLFEVADSLEEIPTICECGKPAMFNARINLDGNIVKHGNQIEIGYDYLTLCRDCYNKS